MCDIYLISTRHKELRKCNSNELNNIFELIKPDIIFEELPPSSFDEFYISKKRSKIETKAIYNYTEKYKINHILVDSDDFPSKDFFLKS